MTSFVLSMAKILLTAAMFHTHIPSHLKQIKELSTFHPFHALPLLTGYYFPSNHV